MTQLVTQATNASISHVMTHLWERGAQELEILGYSRQYVAETIANMRDKGWPTMAFIVDDEPVCVCGLVLEEGGKRAATWFQATEDFTRYQRQITRELRAHMEAAAAERAIEEIEIFSACVHPRAGRWFKALGFELDVDRHPGQDMPRTYRFVRRFPKEEGHVL